MFRLKKYIYAIEYRYKNKKLWFFDHYCHSIKEANKAIRLWSKMEGKDTIARKVIYKRMEKKNVGKK